MNVASRRMIASIDDSGALWKLGIRWKSCLRNPILQINQLQAVWLCGWMPGLDDVNLRLHTSFEASFECLSSRLRKESSNTCQTSQFINQKWFFLELNQAKKIIRFSKWFQECKSWYKNFLIFAFCKYISSINIY